MRRREFITLIGSAAAMPLLRAPVARAQEPGRIYRLGMMTGAPRQAPRMVAFFDELKTLGILAYQFQRKPPGLRPADRMGLHPAVGRISP
jgi:hypothetical protein